MQTHLARSATKRAVAIAVAAALAVPALADEPDGKDPRDSLFDEVYRESLRQIFPLSPPQIEHLRERRDAVTRAVRERRPPEAQTRTIDATLETGAKPATVRIAPGYVTAIEVLDATGAPWPVEFASIGDPKGFSLIKPEGVEPGNLVTISTLGSYSHSNLLLKLKGEPTPLVLQIAAAQNVSEQLVSVRLDRDGPLAAPPVVGPAPQRTLGEEMQAFLDGVPPEGAHTVPFAPSKGARIWSYQDRYYLRTRLALVWPAWDAVARGAGGMRVYRIAPVEMVRVADDAGRERVLRRDMTPGAAPAPRSVSRTGDESHG